MQNLLTTVPMIADRVLVFESRLRDKTARGDVFELEKLIGGLTVDIIGKVVFDAPSPTEGG